MWQNMVWKIVMSCTLRFSMYYWCIIHGLYVKQGLFFLSLRLGNGTFSLNPGGYWGWRSITRCMELGHCYYHLFQTHSVLHLQPLTNLACRRWVWQQSFVSRVYVFCHHINMGRNLIQWSQLASVTLPCHEGVSSRPSMYATQGLRCLILSTPSFQNILLDLTPRSINRILSLNLDWVWGHQDQTSERSLLERNNC